MRSGSPARNDYGPRTQPPPARKESLTFRTLTFSGCGGLYSYMLGITAEIQQRYDLTHTRFLTASGGSLSGLVLAAGLDAEHFHRECNRRMLEDCHARATGFVFNIQRYARQRLRDYLPETAYRTCTHRLVISLTALPQWRNESISVYRSNDELIDSIASTTFWPVVFDGRWSARLNGRHYWDGALTFDPAADGDETLVICSTLWQRMPWRWRMPWADPAWHDRLFYWGAQDAHRQLPAYVSACMARSLPTPIDIHQSGGPLPACLLEAS